MEPASILVPMETLIRESGTRGCVMGRAWLSSLGALATRASSSTTMQTGKERKRQASCDCQEGIAHQKGSTALQVWQSQV